MAGRPVWIAVSTYRRKWICVSDLGTHKAVKVQLIVMNNRWGLGRVMKGLKINRMDDG